MVYNTTKGGSEMKTKEKLEARRIRVEEQLSLKDIASKLGVSKGSVSRWVKDLPLPVSVIRGRNMAGCTKAGEILHKNAKAARIKHQHNGRKMAVRYKNYPLFMAGCMMHWAEGSKSRNSVRICNTDAHFLRLWVKFIQQFFDVRSDNFRLAVHCHLDNGKTQQQIELYWIKQLSFPQSCLRTTTLIASHSTSTGAKVNRHPYGVASVTVHSTEIIQQIWGAIKFFAEINDDDRWVD